MRKSAMLALVVLHGACARGGADLGVDDNDETINPSQGEDSGASGGDATSGEAGMNGAGGSSGASGGWNSTSGGWGSTGAGTGTTGDTTGGTGDTTGGDSSGGDSTGGDSTGGDSTGASTGSSSGGSSGSTTGGSSGGSSGSTTGASTGGTTGAECTGGTITCEQAAMFGSIDGSDETSKLMKQGTGSGWFSFDVTDGNLNNMGNSRIGLRATLTAPTGSYQVTLVGDTSPSGAGRCAVADVTDTTPLSKSAIWGSYGPVVAKKRSLTVHVQHLSGACDGTWTLTVTGNPCPAATIGFGENSLGSCP